MANMRWHDREDGLVRLLKRIFESTAESRLAFFPIFNAGFISMGRLDRHESHYMWVDRLLYATWYILESVCIGFKGQIALSAHKETGTSTPLKNVVLEKS